MIGRSVLALMPTGAGKSLCLSAARAFSAAAGRRCFSLDCVDAGPAGKGGRC